MKIKISKELIHNSLVNGDGIRTVIFFTGCDKNCPGCHNKALQDFDAGISANIDDIVNEIIQEKELIDGVTLSGGDPICQSSGATELCRKLKEHNINIWLYTGESYDNLRGNSILKYLDVIVDGRFDESLVNKHLKYRGSSNQRIIYLNNDGLPVKIIS